VVSLLLDNRLLYVRGASRATIRAIEDITSYRVAGFMFAPSFKAKRWDGKEHLLCYSTKRGYHAPVGLATDICRLLNERGERYRVRFQTRLKHRRRRLAWNPEVGLRGYQLEAVDAILGKPVPGSGILKMPIRSGKTRTAARLIWRIGRPALFIVPSQMLLHQTYAALVDALPRCGIGRVGDSEYDPDYITVATIHTLARMRGKRGERKPDPKYKGLMGQFDLVIFDECHHIRGESGWRKVMADADARFKVGLSATAYLDNESENERGIIWLKATCGPIRVDISVSRLVEEGHLMRQNVKMYRVTKPDRNGLKWSATLQRSCIVENRHRNRLIARLAHLHASFGMKIIIIARLLDHIAAICDAMDDRGLEYRTITGRDSSATREELVGGLVDGEYPVLIGTVLGEGIDIPSVECVINAEGGSDIKSATQRQRNLTVATGKHQAIFIDFYDDTNEYFRKHSEARLEVYRSEDAYSVEVIEEKKARPIGSEGRMISDGS
jgi:superfamily II DNA or RNA helicase